MEDYSISNVRVVEDDLTVCYWDERVMYNE